MALSLDGKAASTFTLDFTGSVSLTTSDTNDVIVIIIGFGATAAQGAQSVSRVEAIGLTFAKRGAHGITGSGGDSVGLEMWWAPSASALTGTVITVTMSGVIDDACLTAFGVNGCSNIGAPWDTHSGLPAFTSGNPAPNVTFSTTQTHDFLIGAGATNFGVQFSTPSWTTIENIVNAGGGAWCLTASAYDIVSAVQTGTTGGVQRGSTALGVILADALTGDSSLPAGDSVATWAGAGALAAVGVANQSVATWTGSGAFVGNVSTPVGPTIGALTGVGKIAWVPGGTVTSHATLTGHGAFVGVAAGPAPAVAVWTGIGNLTGVSRHTVASVATMAGSGVLAWVKFANAPAVFTMTGVGDLDTQGEFNVPQINPFWSVPINGDIVEFVAYNWQTRQMFVGYEDRTFTLLDNVSLGQATQIRTAAPNAEAMVLALVAS